MTAADVRHDLIGHQRQREWFQQAISRGRLASTFLFVGQRGIGKRTFALWLAKSLLCTTKPAEQLSPCGACSNCIQVAAGTHPDILQVRRPADRAGIPIELLVGPRDARMREGLCHDLRLRPMAGERRIAIIDDCDDLNVEGANALLKTLEEPPPRSIVILIGTSEQRQLPTIRSRCQVVRFSPPLGDEALAVLIRRCAGMELSDQALRDALAAAEGNLEDAFKLASDDFRAFSGHLRELLKRSPPEALTLAQAVGQFVDAAGSEAPQRRQRMQDVASFAADILRAQLRQAAHAGEVGGHDTQQILYRVLRCLEWKVQIDRFANQANLIEAWAADMQRGEPLEGGEEVFSAR